MPLVDQNARTAHGLEPVIERRYPLAMAMDTPDSEDDTSRDPVAIALGGRVRLLRKGKRQTQGDLAEASGIDRRYLSRLETGDKNPTLRALARIADALGVTLSDLFRDVPGYGRPLENRPYERK